MLIFTVYFVCTFITYCVINVLYDYEINCVWRVPRANEDAVLLWVVKSAHWACSMQLDAWAGALTSAVVTSVAFFGIQRYVDLRLAGRSAPFSVKLWSMSLYSLANVLDSWVHLYVFNIAAAYTGDPMLLALANVVGHTVGLLLTYPVTAIQRGRKTYWDGFAAYYVRSSVAAFCITFLASLFID